MFLPRKDIMTKVDAKLLRQLALLKEGGVFAPPIRYAFFVPSAATQLMNKERWNQPQLQIADVKIRRSVSPTLLMCFCPDTRCFTFWCLRQGCTVLTTCRVRLATDQSRLNVLRRNHEANSGVCARTLGHWAAISAALSAMLFARLGNSD